MRTKGNKQKQLDLFKSFARNWVRFYRVIFLEKDALLFLRLLQIKYFQKLAPKEIFLDMSADVMQCFMKRSKGIDLGSECVEKFLTDEQRRELFGSINQFLTRYKLGQEWQTSIVAFVSCGIVCPPVYNLYFYKETIPMPPKVTDDKTVKRYRRYGVPIHIVLNPDTSIEDIRDAWDEIQAQQDISWIGHKRHNLTKNSFKTLMEAAKVQLEKMNLSDEEKYAALTTYEKLQAKRFNGDLAATRRAILQYRRNVGKKSVEVKIKDKLTDEDWVRKNLGLRGTAAKRAAATIRQRRHRSKM